jgi:hypothetical protein
MPVRRGAGGAPPSPRGVPYVLWFWMHDVMCDSRRASKLGRLCEGSSRWQIGHSSSSAIWGVGGNALCLEDDSPSELYRFGYEEGDED